MANIGQGAGVYYSQKDKTGGGEDLQQTLTIGNKTIDKNIEISDNTEIQFFGANSKIKSAINGTGNFGTVQYGVIGATSDYNHFVGLVSNSYVIKDTVSNRGFLIQPNFIEIDFNNLGNSIQIHNQTDVLNQLVFNNIANRIYKFPDIEGTTILSTSFQEKAEAVFLNTTVSTWEAITVPGASANSTVQIAMQNTSSSGQTAGVRMVGSIKNRIMTAKGMANFVTVLTDGSGQIEIFSGSLTAIQFRLWGEYTTV